MRSDNMKMRERFLIPADFFIFKMKINIFPHKHAIIFCEIISDRTRSAFNLNIIKGQFALFAHEINFYVESGVGESKLYRSHHVLQKGNAFPCPRHAALLGFVKSLNVPINKFNCLNIRNRIRIFPVVDASLVLVTGNYDIVLTIFFLCFISCR